MYNHVNILTTLNSILKMVKNINFVIHICIFYHNKKLHPLQHYTKMKKRNFFFGAMPHNLWDLSSLTRDRIRAPYSGSMKP